MLSFLRTKETHSLFEEIERVQREYDEAEMMLNFADPDFIDQAVCRINMAKSQLDALIRVAKKQELQAWTETLSPVAMEPAEEDKG